MADLDPQTLAALNQAMQAMQQVMATLSKQTGTTAADMQKFGAGSLEQIKTGLTGLHKEVKGGTKNFRDLGGDLRNYQQQINLLKDPIEKETAQRKLATLATKAYEDSMTSGAKQLGVVLVKGLYDYYKTQVMAGVRGLQGDGSPFQVAADLQRAQIESVASTAGQFGSTMGKVGQGLMMIPHPAAMVVGALMNIGGGILESGAKEAAELMKFQLEVVSKELEKSYKSFQQATAAGALFAGGMTELRETGLKGGLVQEQFSKVIADNSLALAAFGGDVTTGAKKLSGVLGEFSRDSGKTRKQLLNLGITVEDQAQGTADYMAMLQRTGNLRGQSDAQLAEESKNYMVQLKAISSFTGEDAKKAEARAKQAAAQGAVAAKLQDLGPEAAAKFNAAIKLLPESQQKAAQQMLAFGNIIDPELAMTLGPASTQLLSGVISDVKDANVTAEGAQQNFYKTLDELSPALQSEGKKMAEIFGRVALANGQYANQSSIAADILALANKNLRKTAGEDGGAGTALDKAKLALETQDKLTTEVGRSVHELQGMKISLQTELTPAIKKFADEVPKILAAFQKKMRDLGLWGDEPPPPALTQPAQNVVNSSDALRASVGLAPTKMTTEEAAAVERATERFNSSLTGRLSNWITSWGEEKPDAQSPALDGVMATGGIIGARRGGVPILAAEAGLNEAFVPLPDGKRIPVDMSSMAERLGSLFGKKDNSIDEDFKRQLLENNSLVITALKQMQEIYTKSMETTKLVSSTIAADSEASAALLEAMNAVVGVLEDSKYELQDQSSSLKKLYDVTA
jgi:hypothetical protein